MKRTLAHRLFLSTALSLAASYAWATKPEPPFRVNLKLVDAASVRLGSTATVEVDVQTDADLDDVRVRFESTDALPLLSSATEWRGAVYTGSELQLFVSVGVVEEGEHAVTAVVNSAGATRRASLHFLVTKSEVLSSMDDPFWLHWRSARTDAARSALLRDTLHPVTISPDEEPLPDPFLEGLAARYRRGADESTSLPYELAARNVRVRARVFYKDIAGTNHPMRFVKVEVVDDDSPGANQVLATTHANSAGVVDTTVLVPDPVDADATDVDLKLVIYTSLLGDSVASVGATTATTYTVVSGVTTNYAGVDLNLGDLATAAPVANGGAGDSLLARAFSVLDAVLQEGVEALQLRGTLLPRIPIVFPTPNSTSSFCGNHARPADCAGMCAASDQLNILRLDALDWDVLFHEFGHYVTTDGAASDLNDSCGGTHGINASTIPTHTKARGARLSWNEGLATWFGMAVGREGTIALPSIPNAGDVLYEDTEDLTITFSMEDSGNGGAGVGYADELSVMRTLWDLQDSAADTSADSTARDTLSRTLAQMWRLLGLDANNSLPRFWTSIATRSPSTRLTVKAAALFALNNAAPEALTPVDDAVLSPVVGGTFTWTPNGDPTVGFGNNEFRLLISKDDWASYEEFGPFAGMSFTVPDAMWTPLFADAELDTIYRWVIAGKNTAAPATPGGADTLTGYFLSQEKRFTPKAIEIKMTWPLLGSDVDLHLRPPDGAGFVGWHYLGDCAYYNLSPDFGTAGDPRDNPTLDRDCITSCTEENITLDTVTTPGTYKVIAHYFRDHGLGPTSVTVQVKRFGRVVRTATMTLSNGPDSPDSGDVWTVFSFTRSAFGIDFGGFGPGDPDGTVRHGSEPSGPAPPKSVD